MDLGERIQSIRKSKNMTQQELADKIGVKRSVVSKYENNSVNISVDTIEKIANALGVETSELLYEQSELMAQLTRMYDMHDVLNSTKAAFNLNVIDSMKIMFKEHPELFQEDTHPEEKSINDDTISKLETLNTLGQQKANEYITDLSEQEKYTKPDNEE